MQTDNAPGIQLSIQMPEYLVQIRIKDKKCHRLFIEIGKPYKFFIYEKPLPY